MKFIKAVSGAVFYMINAVYHVKYKLLKCLPSSISGGRPPTNTFLEYLSMRSISERGDPFREEFREGTI